jgi:hypothetical protein
LAPERHTQLNVEGRPQQLAAQPGFDSLEYIGCDLAAAEILIQQRQGVPGRLRRAAREHLDRAQKGLFIAAAAGERIQPDLADVEIPLNPRVI